MLPPSLNAADESRKMALAYVCEAYNAVVSEAAAAERRYRQSLVATRSFELRMNAACDKVPQLKLRLDMLVGLALDEIAATTRSTDMVDDVTSESGSNILSEPSDYTSKCCLNSCCCC
jgi:hypothetical protein